MSNKCLLAIPHTTNPVNLIDEVLLCAQNDHCGIFLNPKSALLCINKRYFDDFTLVFEICDGFQNDDASMLLSYDNYFINGRKPNRPLKERLIVIQNVVQKCLHYTTSIRLYISSDNPFLPEYIKREVSKDIVANVLYEYYTHNSDKQSIPSIELTVS